MQNIRVIKLGGSVVSREDNIFDFEFLKKFKEILVKRIKLGEKFCIVVGGGYACRMYLKLARESGAVNSINDLHWIGTTMNVLHSELVRSVFSDLAYERPLIYEQYYDNKPINMEKPILLGGGGRPGHSGDMDAILMGLKVGANTIISMKNVDYLYSADPKKDPSAQKVDKTNWDGYFKIIGDKKEHEPGGNYVVDPSSAQKAKEKGVKFVIMKGDDLVNFEAYLENKDFKGSIIE